MALLTSRHRTTSMTQPPPSYVHKRIENWSKDTDPLCTQRNTVCDSQHVEVTQTYLHRQADNVVYPHSRVLVTEREETDP